MNVAELAGQFATSIGAGQTGRLIGLLHDLGKYSDEFQSYLNSAAGRLDQDHDEEFLDLPALKGKIDHSTAGAQRLFQDLRARGAAENIVGELMALCIASHHSGLIDCIAPDGTQILERRLGKQDRRTHLNEAWTSSDPIVQQEYERTLDGAIRDLREVITAICRQGEPEKIVRFKVGLLARFLLSCLVDADRIDTADFENPGSARQRLRGVYGDWDVLSKRLERRIDGFSSERRVDVLRRAVSDACLQAGTRNRGLFSLSVPTGGGKTLASLRFALNHAAQHGMDRIIYVIPYTSIIDQNAQEVRTILEPAGVQIGSVVLEHHSNLVPERQNWRNKVLSENWDAPVVFTTTVQLLEALFGAGTRGVRRMHQMANAVIILDEIQTLPIRCIHLFNNAMNFLAEICGSSILLCTATQPLLGKVDSSRGALKLSDKSEIVEDVSELYRSLKRVEVFDARKSGGWTDEEVAELALSQVDESKSCLVVVNTKLAARNVYENAKSRRPDSALVHLSTSMCPQHRRERLRVIRNSLDSGIPLLCVSTQLIEAGVDVDFGSVVRYMAGIDSIAQAAGRCNRHGIRSCGRVFVVNPATDGGEMLVDIAVGKRVSERVLDEISGSYDDLDGDILSPRVLEHYFNYYFFERRKEMTYPVRAGEKSVERDDTLLNMLSENVAAANEAGRLSRYMRQSFQSAADIFQVIEAPAQGVIVPYEEGKDLIGLLCSTTDAKQQGVLLRRAQQFTVNVFPNLLERLRKQTAVHEVQEGTGILYLSSEFYDSEFGLTETPTQMEFLNG